MDDFERDLEGTISEIESNMPNATRKQKRIMRYELGIYRNVLEKYRSFQDVNRDTDYVDGQPKTIQIGDYLK